MPSLVDIQDWLSRRVPFVPRPQHLPPGLRYARLRWIAYRWRVMDGKRRGWVLFGIFWGGAIALAIFGNLIPQ